MNSTDGTPWEVAARSSGVTGSERYLARMARKAFLSLWSYSNLYTDEGRRLGKGDGKELCDLLVVFGNNVLVFSDKHCEFPAHSDINVAWSRWYRRAVEKSARQLSGAENFIKQYPTRIYLDKDCKSRLPISLPNPSEARYFLIAVTRGSARAVEQFFGGGSSGSLLIDTGLAGVAHAERPFHVGFPLDSHRFVHVLDEMTVDVLLEELDTITDFVDYLRSKEELLTQTGVRIVITGEEQVLARYIRTIENGAHALPRFPDDAGYVLWPEGDWECYATSSQREAKRKADEISYLWDNLIEYQSSFIRAGTAISLPDTEPCPDDHERIVRALAEETRLMRRQLAGHLKHAIFQSEPGKKFARVVVSSSRSDRAYVFLTAVRPKGVPYESYRETRTDILRTYIHGVKLRVPSIREVVGIASEPMTEAVGSQDFMYFEFSGEPLTEEFASALREAMEELEVLQAPTVRTVSGVDHEFPMPFEFSGRTELRSTNDGMPMNRKARRAMAKAARRKK